MKVVAVLPLVVVAALSAPQIIYIYMYINFEGCCRIATGGCSRSLSSPNGHRLPTALTAMSGQRIRFSEKSHEIFGNSLVYCISI